MPRFYFDTREGDLVHPDELGQPLDTVVAARDLAMAMLPQIVGTSASSGDRRELRVDVRDERGAVLLSVRLAMCTHWAKPDAATGEYDSSVRLQA